MLAVLSDEDKRSMYDAGFLDLLEEDEVRNFPPFSQVIIKKFPDFYPHVSDIPQLLVSDKNYSLRR